MKLLFPIVFFFEVSSSVQFDAVTREYGNINGRMAENADAVAQ